MARLFRYHSFRSPRYPLPNDVIEQQREELMHELFTEIMEGRLFIAPLEKGPTKVLDLCTGVGLWAIEVGDQFPQAQVLGVDLSPIQPKGVPPNVTFEVDDVEDVWAHDTDYDLIHMREASSYIGSTPKVIEKAFQHLKPGGWVELQDFHYEAYSEDGTMPTNCPINQFADHMYVYGYAEGRNFHAVPNIDDFMGKAGFINIQKKVYKVPFGSWPEDEKARRMGIYLKVAFESAMAPCARSVTNLIFDHYQVVQGVVSTGELIYSGVLHLCFISNDSSIPLNKVITNVDLCIRLLASSGLTPVQIESLFAEVSQFLNNHDIHCWTDYYVWVGQKPPV
ncbi:S-adenosyl-L-methionine-dependent methyltransferase [Whalleya microplaca]|nr:S-adenosyl-L-methionine-dependent methyltransferase [Whalleya microplaca]